jgi:hypothetical protein
VTTKPAHPVLMFVNGERRAAHYQRDHDPGVLRFLPLFNCGAYRSNTIIVERHNPVSDYDVARWAEWTHWLPTRLTRDGAITFL